MTWNTLGGTCSILTKRWWSECNGSVFFLFLSYLQLDHILSAIRLHLILSYVVSYLHVLSYSSLNLCLVLCTLPPLMSYSLALSSTMMSCTVHSPTDSLVQPACILVYIECNPAPGGSPFELSLGLRSNSRVLFPFPSESPSVVVCPRSALGCLTEGFWAYFQARWRLPDLETGDRDCR